MLGGRLQWGMPPACHPWPSPIESLSPGFPGPPYLPSEIPFPLSRAFLVVLSQVAQGGPVIL